MLETLGLYLGIPASIATLVTIVIAAEKKWRPLRQIWDWFYRLTPSYQIKAELAAMTHLFVLGNERTDAEIKAMQEQITSLEGQLADLQGSVTQAFWQLLRLVNGMPYDPNESIRLKDFADLLDKWTAQPVSSANQNDTIAARLADLEAAQAKYLSGTLDHSPPAERIRQRAKDSKEHADTPD